MLSLSLLPHLASQTELLRHQMHHPSTCEDKMRSSPGPSYSNNDSHDVTGIAPSALGDGAKSVQHGGEVARSGTRPAYEDCQCSADSLNPSTNHADPSRGATNTQALQAPHQRMPFFPQSPLPAFAKAPEHGKPAIGTSGVPRPIPATSSSDFKRSRAMDYKKSRMVWSEELHTQFLRALSDIGLRHAVPKTIMQRMGVDTLTRENVASHLQKYRLALKRKAHLPDNALMTASSWRLLEQAHDDVVNHLPPPAAPAAPLSAAALNITSHNMASPSRAGASSPSVGASKLSAASGPGRSTNPLPPLPPLMPSSSAVPTLADLANVSAAMHTGSPGAPCTLPPGYSVPLPNADGIAVGIPMPLHFLPKRASVGRQKPSSLPPMASAAQGSLPDLPSITCAPKLEPSAQAVSNVPEAARTDSAHPSPPGAAHGTAAEDGTSANDPMCTVYMLDPSTYSQHGAAGQLPPLCGPHQGHSLMKATQVPQMLLSVSAAAYGGVHGIAPEGAVPGPANSTLIASGAPLGEATLSSGSASKPDAVDDEEASPPKRRRRVSVRVERLPGEEDLSPRRARAKVPRTGGLKGSPSSGFAGTAAASIPLFHPANAHLERATAREPDFRGSCSALDALAEVAGRFANGEAM